MLAAYLDLSHPLVWTTPPLLTPKECQAFIDRIEAMGFADAPITTAAGPVMRQDIRNNTRVMFDDPELARELYTRVLPHVPETLLHMKVVGTNERLRCYRYTPGQRFAPHYDGAFVRDEHERSLLTFMVYLNEDFEGGETNMLELGQSIKPQTGMGLLFQHAILHEGAEVTRGTKYAVRSDVMYRRV